MLANEREARRGFLYKGERLYAAKAFLNGTHRAKTPFDTLESVRPLFDPAGITRFADVTHLDRIGVPVTLAIRPNSRTLSVSSGKGLDMGCAMVSAAMEALELFHSEHAELPSITCSFKEIAGKGPTIPIESLPVRIGSLFNPDWPETWVYGWDLFNHREVAVPLQVAQMAPKKLGTAIQSIASFVADSNGLCSGNNVVETLLSGIYEVVERDAIALHKSASEVYGYLIGRIELASIPYETTQRILDNIRAANSDLVLYDCTSDIGIPSYRAVLVGPDYGPASLVEGFGTHLSDEVAIIRAITEACQGRAVVISGARDDIFNFVLDKLKHVKASDHFANLMTVEGTSLVTRNLTTDSLDEDLNLVLKLLEAAKIEQLITVDLRLFDCEQVFMKVIIPSLEGYPSYGYLPGRRAKDVSRKCREHRKTTGETGYSMTMWHLPAGGDVR
jgi:ribosomal protein S12 methylthiotransferase accessory factor